jgi:hypothetical protein
MTTNRKLLWGGLGLLVLTFVCCFGVLLGSALSRDKVEPTAPLALATATPVPLPPTRPPATVVVIEPKPTNTLVVAPATPTPIIIVVTATPVVSPSATLRTGPVEPPLPAEPPTAVPTLPPATPAPPAQPTRPDADFQALVAYAEAIKPILDEGLAAAERDGDILEASEENPDALCGGGLNPHPTLVADAALMDDLMNRLKGITPPAEAANPVHKPLVDSVRLWGDALDSILSCQTDDPAAQGLLRLGAVLQLGGSMLNFRIASDNFWRLVIVNGLEAIVGPPPGQ